MKFGVKISCQGEYTSITHTSDLMWFTNPLKDFWIFFTLSMTVHWNNQSAIYISSNYGFYERIKDIKVDCYFLEYTFVLK